MKTKEMKVGDVIVDGKSSSIMIITKEVFLNPTDGYNKIEFTNVSISTLGIYMKPGIYENAGYIDHDSNSDFFNIADYNTYRKIMDSIFGKRN